MKIDPYAHPFGEVRVPGISQGFSSGREDEMDKKQDKLRRMAKGAVESYERQLEIVVGAMRQALAMTTELESERAALLEELRETYARTVCMRKKDFDTVIRRTTQPTETRAAELSRRIDAFEADRRESTAGLKDLMSNGKAIRPEVWSRFKELLLAPEQQDSERELAKILRVLHLEQEEINSLLRKILLKKEVKVKDLRNLARLVDSNRDLRTAELEPALVDCEEVHGRICNIWRDVMNTHAKTMEG